MKHLVYFLAILATANAGLLRVPKVYNAVITSNQNLSPSRAFPVIQPVIHRTAIGYVPPLYYTQVTTHFSGPQPDNVAETTKKSIIGKDINPESSGSQEELPKPSDESKDREETTERSPQSNPRSDAKTKMEEEPLTFYPNYHSLYYDPYIYTYNGYNAHFVPGTYYVDYQPYRPLAPIPAAMPKNAQVGHLLPGYHEKNRGTDPRDQQPLDKAPSPVSPIPLKTP